MHLLTFAAMSIPTLYSFLSRDLFIVKYGGVFFKKKISIHIFIFTWNWQQQMFCWWAIWWREGDWWMMDWRRWGDLETLKEDLCDPPSSEGRWGIGRSISFEQDSRSDCSKVGSLGSCSLLGIGSFGSSLTSWAVFWAGSGVLNIPDGRFGISVVVEGGMLCTACCELEAVNKRWLWFI